MLSPYTVLDLTDHRGDLAAMVLGDLGADVIKVEPPDGSAGRRIGPFLHGAPEAERSLRFFAYNRNKRSLTLDLTRDADRQTFHRLVERADFLIESAEPGEMDALGLGFDSLRALNPRLVYVAITPFGRDGPHAHFTATDLTIAAMGGPISLQGTPERAPVRVSVPQVWRHAAVEAAVGALTAHARTLRTGEAQFVDVSAQCVVVWTMLNAMAAHAIQGADFERHGSDLQLGHITIPLLHPCADGHVVMRPNGLLMAGAVRHLVEEGIVPPHWLEAEDWATYDRRLAAEEPLTISPERLADAVVRYARMHTKEDLFERGLRDGVSFAPVNTVADVIKLRHLEERDYWIDAPLPDGRTARAPGPSVRLSKTPLSVGRRAPRLGEHSAEILSALRNAPPATPAPSPDHDPLPFAGLKVADFSWIGVGPITAKHLADHGATVVHVETEDPADKVRVGGPFKDGVVGPNRSQFFVDFNTSKLSLSLNLKNSAARDVARRLIAWADVYLESFTPGTAHDLGIGYDDVREENPSLIMVGTCLMGQTGPVATFAGYGYHAGAIAGFYEITGWPDLPPDGPWMAYTDTIAPRFLAATLMAALDHRRRTGEGQYIDAAQLEMALHFLAPELLDYQANGRVATRQGNRSDSMAPHGVYPCRGIDQWCAIAVAGNAQWQALRRVLGDPGWAGDERLDSVAGRLQRQDELDARLSDWTRARPPADVMTTLQAAGVAAGVVQRSSDLLKDPQLAHRRFHRYMQHGEMGRIPHTGHQFRIRDYDSGPRFSAPLLGEHSLHVMRDVLAMTDAEIGEVYAAGAVV